MCLENSHYYYLMSPKIQSHQFPGENRLRDKVPCKPRSHHGSRSNKTEEGEARRGDLMTTPMLSQTKKRIAVIGREPKGGKQHAKMDVPFEELNRG